MSSGWQNPVPLAIGPIGDAEKTLGALLDAWGKGWVPKDLDAGPWGLFMQSCAEGLAAIAAWGEHAFAQSFPATSSDYIPVYESFLGISPVKGASEEDRRRVIAAEWVAAQASSDGPTLIAGLLEVDPRASLMAVDWDDEDTTVMGRPVGDSLEDYGTFRDATEYPAYSGAEVAYVLLDVGYLGALTDLDQVAAKAIKKYLAVVLPSPVDFAVITSVGFKAGTSPLGYTGGG